MRILPLLLLAGLLAPAPAWEQDGVMVLRFGHLWDGERLVDNATVVVTGDRITAVGGVRTSVPKGAREIDLRPYTAIPGLIDLHTHITYFWDRAPGTTPLRQGQRRTPEETARVAADNAKRT